MEPNYVNTGIVHATCALWITTILPLDRLIRGVVAAQVGPDVGSNDGVLKCLFSSGCVMGQLPMWLDL
jgi:hypothetical protein